MTNPFDFGRNMMELWEKSMTDTFERLTKDEQFLKSMSQVMSQSLDVRKHLGSQIESYLTSINMPSKSELDRMLCYLQRVEAKLLDLEDQFAEIRDEISALRSGPTAKPKPAKRSPAAKKA